MHELLRLLGEYGASDDLIALATRFLDGDDGPTSLDDTELEALLTGLTALADDDEASAAILGEAADAAASIRDEQGRRESDAAAEEAERAAAAARLRGDDPDADAGDDGGDGGDVDDPAATAGDGDDDDDPGDDDGDDGDDPADTDAGDREPATVASNRAARRAAARRRPRNARPSAAQRRGSPIVFASAVPGQDTGSTTYDLRDVDRAMERLHASFRRGGGGKGGKQYLPVATVMGQFAADRRLVDETGEALSPSHTTRVIRAALDNALDRVMADPEARALVAAGGLCAPPTPIYDVRTYGDARRPVRDQALVSFLAPRGGVTDLTPPQLGDLSGAISQWTVANDVDAAPDGVPSKPCLRVTCGAPRTTQIYAVPFCLTVGNFLARTMGEIPAAWSSLGQVAQARFAESLMIARMQSLATTVTTTTSDWSATRDVLNELNQGAWGMRSRHRLADDFPFRAVLPSILQGIMQTDISRQLPGDPAANMRLAAAELEGWFRARSINVTWSPDMNIVGPQAAGTVLAHWPPSVNYLLYPEGTFIHLDAGELDFGVVRDSALNRVNDFQVFSESFENVHMVGVEAIDGSIDVCPTGAVSGTIDPAPFCASYSAPN